MNYTSVEQSKKLVELGINPNTADMYYTSLDSHNIPWVWNSKPLLEVNDIPCWSIGALIDLLPSELTIEDETYFLFIDVRCKTILYKSHNKYWQEFPSFVADILIDNIILVIKWLKEHKYM